MAKLLFKADEAGDEMTGVLVNVSYNDGYGRVCGYYYDAAERDTLPTLGGYLDLKQCMACTADDIDECRTDDLKKMQQEREDGTRPESEWEEWEHRQVRMDKKVDMLGKKVTSGAMSLAKYLRLRQEVYGGGNLGAHDHDNEFEIDDGHPGSD